MTKEELEIAQAACCVGTMWDQYEGTEKFNEMVGKRVWHLIELVRNHLEQEQLGVQNGKFVFPKYLYARTKDNKTIDMSYVPQDMTAIEYVRNDLVQQEQPDVSARHGWVARDMNNDLHYFSVKPVRSGAKWWDRDYLSMEVDGSLFGELTWEDEPIEVELFIRELGLNANQI